MNSGFANSMRLYKFFYLKQEELALNKLYNLLGGIVYFTPHTQLETLNFGILMSFCAWNRFKMLYF